MLTHYTTALDMGQYKVDGQLDFESKSKLFKFIDSDMPGMDEEDKVEHTVLPLLLSFPPSPICFYNTLTLVYIYTPVCKSL